MEECRVVPNVIVGSVFVLMLRSEGRGSGSTSRYVRLRVGSVEGHCSI